jgi:hypothetical protein
VLVTNAEQQTDAQKLSDKRMKERRFREAVSIGLEDLATCLYIVDEEHLRVEPGKTSYEWCLRPPLHPLEIEFIWSRPTENAQGVAN